MRAPAVKTRVFGRVVKGTVRLLHQGVTLLMYFDLTLDGREALLASPIIVQSPSVSLIVSPEEGCSEANKPGRPPLQVQREDMLLRGLGDNSVGIHRDAVVIANPSSG
jgi:hypothetical protein